MLILIWLQNIISNALEISLKKNIRYFLSKVDLQYYEGLYFRYTQNFTLVLDGNLIIFCRHFLYSWSITLSWNVDTSLTKGCLTKVTFNRVNCFQFDNWYKNKSTICLRMYLTELLFLWQTQIQTIKYGLNDT